MKNTRGVIKARRQYDDEVKRCIVCGRLFTRQVRDKVCSVACAEKVKQEAAAKPIGDSPIESGGTAG
jgi:hypothetical protein